MKALVIGGAMFIGSHSVEAPSHNVSEVSNGCKGGSTL